jgi:hypothetical protein
LTPIVTDELKTASSAAKHSHENDHEEEKAPAEEECRAYE